MDYIFEGILMNMKKIVILILTLLLTLGGIQTARAAEFPDAFWDLRDNCNAALAAGDNLGVINYAKQIIDLLITQPECTEFNENIATNALRLGEAYEKLDEYPLAKEAFETYYMPYAEKMGWTDGVKSAKAKIVQYADRLEFYTASYGAEAYYGAKFEPKTGVLYGITSDSETRQELSGDSAVLLYHEFGDEYFDWAESVLKDAEKTGRAVEFALNVPREGGQLGEVLNSRDYIVRVVKMLGKYNIPVFLRFGAEMNTWGVRADPSEFIAAFRFVAQLARENADNIAMVWSPMYVSPWDVDTNDFYPGDEYVDWVGCSLYMQKYFNGRNDLADDEKYLEAFFGMGPGATPVKMLNELIGLYGGRKPIMISESGAGHYSRTTGEDLTGWAVSHMRELYSFVPMVYPQVKAIFYFDKVMPDEPSDYALTTNTALKNEFLTLTGQPWFIEGNADGVANQTFKKFYEGITLDKSIATFYAFTSFYGKDDVNVDYYIDDAFVSSSSRVPYECSVDLNKYSEGAHSIKIVSNGIEKSYSFIVDRAVKIKINGAVLDNLDTNPVIADGRTLVPLRAVFEKMGAKVDWNDETKTAAVSMDNVSASVTLGKSILNRNGEEITLDVPAKLVGGRTMVPVRAISEAINAQVNWNEAENTVEITK